MQAELRYLAYSGLQLERSSQSTGFFTRNILYIVMVPPQCLTAVQFCRYNPADLYPISSPHEGPSEDTSPFNIPIRNYDDRSVAGLDDAGSEAA
jgi:hypothetical protein